MALVADLSDDEILTRVRSGDTASFETLMRRYNRRIFRVARAILRSDTDAEDVVQSAYTRAYFQLSRFEGKAAFSTWLTRIAVHEACAMLRRARSRSNAEVTRMDENRNPPSDPERQLLRSELRSLIESATDRLPPEYRIVFILRDVEELTTAETASCLQISEDNVKVRLHRSRVILRRELYDTAGAALRDAFAFDGERCDRIVARVLAGVRGVSSVPESTPDPIRSLS